MKSKQFSLNFLRENFHLASLYDIRYKLCLLYDDCNGEGKLDCSANGQLLYECFDEVFKKLSQIESIIKS